MAEIISEKGMSEGQRPPCHRLLPQPKRPSRCLLAEATTGLFLLNAGLQTVVEPTCSSPREIAGNRDSWRCCGCEGPRSVAKVASDPGAPSHFSEQQAGLSAVAGATENAH